MKKFITGFLLSTMIFGALPISAEVQEFILQKINYKVFVNGNEYADQEQPILNFKGSTYIPLRKTAEILGVYVNWNADKGQAEIQNASSQIVLVSPSPTPSPKIYTKDGLEFCIINGTVYIQLMSAVNLIQIENSNYKIDATENASSGRNFFLHKGDTIIVNTIPYITVADRLFFEYSFFLNSIIPLIR